jgi:hypothetical protein
MACLGSSTEYKLHAFSSNYPLVGKNLTYAFELHPDLDQIVIIAMAGVYWCNIPVKRSGYQNLTGRQTTFSGK